MCYCTYINDVEDEIVEELEDVIPKDDIIHNAENIISNAKFKI